MRSLVSNIVTEDYVVYAELAGVDSRRILSSYVMRNALVPQVTGLAMSLGAIFNGAVITEKVFGYPGLGSLLIDAVYAGDYGLVLGVTTVSILGVSICVSHHRPALSAPRSARAGWPDAGDPARPAALQPRIPHRRAAGRHRADHGACCPSSRPTRRSTSTSCRRTCRRRLAYWFGTTSRGQDVFWQLTFALRNTLTFGFIVAILSPCPLARHRASRRLQGRLGRPGADVRQRHLHRHPASSRSSSCSTSSCAIDVLDAAGASSWPASAGPMTPG